MAHETVKEFIALEQGALCEAGCTRGSNLWRRQLTVPLCHPPSSSRHTCSGATMAMSTKSPLHRELTVLAQSVRTTKLANSKSNAKSDNQN